MKKPLDNAEDDPKKKSFNYVNRLVTEIDAADGKQDNRIQLSVGIKHVNGLIEKALEQDCPLEEQHLRLILKSLQHYQADNLKSRKKDATAEDIRKEDTYKIPGFAWVRNEIVSLCMSKELTNWYKDHPEDHGCKSAEIKAPADSAKKHQRNER